jgi:hypothetical protein
MKPRRKILWIAVALLLIAGSLLVPEWLYQRAVRKYRLGASADEIERAGGTHIALQPTGNILPSDPAPSEDQRRRHPAYFTRAPCAEVVFNDYRVVIRVLKRTPLQEFRNASR